MKLVWIYIGLCSVVFAEAFQEGQALVSGKATVGSVASTGIVFSENPAEAQYTDNAKISAAVEDEKRTNEAYQQIKHANAERKSYQISLSIPYQNRTTKALEDTLGNTHVETSTSHNSVRKTCFKSGESYTKTCKQQRMIEIKVTPQVTSYKSRYCHGHWVNKVTGSKRHCNPGCQGGEAYISQAKKVDITRDELADYTHVSRGLLHHYFGGFENLKDKILNIAIQQEILPILAEHIADRKELFTIDLKQKVFKYLTN